MASQFPIRDSVREIDSRTVLVGNKLIITLASKIVHGPMWSDNNGNWNSIREVQGTPPESFFLMGEALDLIRPIHDADDNFAVWEVGSAFLKIKKSDTSSPTREHVTLAALKETPRSFDIPTVLFHGEWDGRDYLIVERGHSPSVAEMWPKLIEVEKLRCLDQIMALCQELGRLETGFVGGGDEKQLRDPPMIKSHVEEVFGTCTDLDLDGSNFMFSHCDLDPENLTLDYGGVLGIINCAFNRSVPREWIWARNCTLNGSISPSIDENDEAGWRKRVHGRMPTEDCPKSADEWMTWWTQQYSTHNRVSKKMFSGRRIVSL